MDSDLSNRFKSPSIIPSVIFQSHQTVPTDFVEEPSFFSRQNSNFPFRLNGDIVRIYPAIDVLYRL